MRLSGQAQAPLDREQDRKARPMRREVSGRGAGPRYRKAQVRTG